MDQASGNRIRTSSRADTSGHPSKITGSLPPPLACAIPDSSDPFASIRTVTVPCTVLPHWNTRPAFSKLWPGQQTQRPPCPGPPLSRSALAVGRRFWRDTDQRPSLSLHAPPAVIRGANLGPWHLGGCGCFRNRVGVNPKLVPRS